MKRCIADHRATGARIDQSHLIALVADAHRRANQPEKAIEALERALDLVESTGERIFEAEILRMLGEAALQRGSRRTKTAKSKRPRGACGSEAEAERYFRRAIEVARGQSAKSLELRAATSLGRLLKSQGKVAECRALAKHALEGFTEGFDTADLRDALRLAER